MIVFKYQKIGAAAFISHTDVLRSIIRTLRRAKVDAQYSQGYRPHMNVYMSPPIPLGLESVCEYCAVDSDMPAQKFLQAYNEKCQKNLAATLAVNCSKNPNIAAHAIAAKYYIKSDFLLKNLNQIKSMKNISIISAEGEEKNVANQVLSVGQATEGIIVTLNFGNKLNLRVEKYIEMLKKQFNCDFEVDVLKQKMFVGNESQLIDIDCFLRNYDNKKDL